MKKCVPRLQGLEQQTVKVDKVVFMAVKQDVLEMVRPLSKNLQNNALLTTELITAVSKAVTTLKKIHKLLHYAAFSPFENLFPTASVIITQLMESDNIRIDGQHDLWSGEDGTTHTRFSSAWKFRSCR